MAVGKKKRIKVIVILLLLFMFLAVVIHLIRGHSGDETDGQAGGGFTKEEKEGRHPLLLQCDKRWGNVSYGGERMELSGCAPTCISMVALSLAGNETATPDKVAQYAEQKGYYESGRGTSWSFMTEGAKHFGVRGTEISLNRNTVLDELRAGHMIVCSMRPGDFTKTGHFVVMAEEREGKIVINDPNSKKRSSVLWDYETLEGQIKNLWSFCEG